MHKALLNVVIFLIGLLGALGGFAQSVSVTNLAGRVMRGTLVAVTEHEARLQDVLGQERIIPLRALSGAEQARLRRLAGVPEPKTPVREKLERELANALARIDAREAAGQLSAEEAVQRRAEARRWSDLKQKKQEIK